MEAFIGTILLVAFPWEPAGWMFCDGRSLPIQGYQALYSLLYTTYGGDGRTNFCLPDLRGCVPIGSNNVSPSGILITPGQKGSVTSHGTPSVKTLSMNYIICYNGLYPERP